jgi:acyl carrier protein
MEIKEIKQKVEKIFEKIFGKVPGLNDGTSSKDIREWDSLKHIMLITAVEKEFGIKFGLDDMLNMKTFGDICSSVEKNLQA